MILVDKKKSLCFIIGVIIILIVCFSFSALWYNGKIGMSNPNLKTKILLTESDQYTYSLKDFTISESNLLTAISEDPWLCIVLEEPTIVNNISLDLNIEDLDNKTVCQIFYTTTKDEDFTENKSFKMIIANGKNTIVVPDIECYKLRFDLTNENNTRITLSSIILNDTNYLFLVTFIILSAVSILVLSLYYYGKDDKHSILRYIYIKLQMNSIKRISFVLMLMFLGISLFLVYSKVFFGYATLLYTDIGADTLQDYFPRFVHVSENIKNCNFDFWCGENYLGAPALRNLKGDIFSLLVVFLGSLIGPLNVPALLLILRISTIVLSSVVCFKFLELFSEKYLLISIVSYIYAFNGWDMIWGQHYVFTTYSLYTICFFYVIETFLRKQNVKLSFSLIGLSFIFLLNSVYITYMVFLPGLFYAIIRYVQLNNRFNFKQFVKELFVAIFNCVIGFLCAMMFALPDVGAMVTSGRVTGGVSKLDLFQKLLREWWFENDIVYAFSRFISPNLNGVGYSFGGYCYTNKISNYYEAQQLFFCVIAIMIIFQFVFTIYRYSNSKKSVICRYVSFVLLFCAVFNRGFLYVWYAFSESSNRPLFAIMPILAILFLVVLENIFYRKIFSIAGLITGLALTEYILVDILLTNNVPINIYWLIITDLIIVCICAYIFIEVSCKNQSGIKLKKMILTFSFLIFINCTFETDVAVNEPMRAIVPKTIINSALTDSQTENAINFINNLDNTYYRLDRNYNPYFLSTFTKDSFLYDYKSVSGYDSVMSSGIKEFKNYYMNKDYSFEINWATPRFLQSPNDIIPYSLLGLKYILSDSILESDDYTFVDKVNDIYIYENKFVNSFTTFYDTVISKGNILQENYINRNKLLQSALIVEDEDTKYFTDYLVSKDDILSEFENYEYMVEAFYNNESVNKLFNTNVNGEIEIFIDNNRLNYMEGKIFLEISIIPEHNNKIIVYYNTGNGYDENNKITIWNSNNQCTEGRYTIPKNVKSLKIVFPEESTFINYIHFINCTKPIKNMSNPSIIIDKDNDSHLYGTISCDRDGVLFIPIPYYRGWEVKIDNVITDIYKANSGFMAVKINQGEHTFSIEYQPVEFLFGLSLLILALILGSIYYIMSNKCIKKDKF